MARSRKKRSKKADSKEPLLFSEPELNEPYRGNVPGEDDLGPTPEEYAEIQESLRRVPDLTPAEYEMLRSLGVEEAMSSLDGVPPRKVKRLLRSNAGVAYLRQRIADGKAKMGGGPKSIAEIRAEDQALLSPEMPVAKVAKKARGIRPTKGNLFPGNYSDLPLPVGDSPSPELISGKGQLPLEDVYERAGALRSLEQANQKARQVAADAADDQIRLFVTDPEGPPLPPFPRGKMSPEEIKKARAAAMEAISKEKVRPGVGRARTGYPVRLPKKKWSKAGLLSTGGKLAKGAGLAMGGLFLAAEGAQLLADPAKKLYDWAMSDPVEDQARMLRARAQLIRERQKQEQEGRELQRLRMINTQKIAQLNPQLAMELQAGRILPRGAQVIGGRPRTDIMDSIADAMAEGTLDPSVPDPLAGVLP